MNIMELARKAAALGDQAGACQAYGLAVGGGADLAPAEKLEAADYILRSGGDYKISYTCFRDLYNAGHFQAELLPLMSAAFYEPNEQPIRARYRRNCKLLSKYPYLFRRDFPAFEDLPIRFFPYDDDNGYIPFYRDTMLFGDYVNFDRPVVSRNFFRELDKPVLAADVFSQYELEYLNDNVRKSEYVGRENHIYLHYPDWEVFCAYLQVLDLRPLLKEEKAVFLIGGEISQYPIDFKERFGVDYSRYPVKPLGLREINKLIWHTQLSSHNGGDFFNEIFDGHPNLLSLTSVVLSSLEGEMAELKDALSQAKGSGGAGRDFLGLKDVNGWVLQELFSIPEPTDKDIFTAIYLSNPEITKFLDPAARIVPAVFFQPHFIHIEYDLKADQKNNAVLESAQYDRLCASPIFQGFKYIKTFTPLRRFTSSHGATVRFMYAAAQLRMKERLGSAGQDNGPPSLSVVGDAVSQRVLNRGFMIDWQDRLFKDSVLVRFEDGKLNPKATFTALAAFLDLPYTQSMARCTMNGEPLDYLGYITDGFDPAPVYKTYDDFVNDSERAYIEYFLRDAYEFYGYDFHYYDGRPVTPERVKEWMKGFTTIDHYIRESWKDVYDVIELPEVPESDPQVAEEVKRRLRQGLLEGQIEKLHQDRETTSEILMRGLRFLNRSGQPLHMMPLLALDPALLEQPLYH